MSDLQTTPTKLITRWAPTPSGWLHTGNALNAILVFAIARRLNGQVYLRIDDLDSPRVRHEYVEDIFLSLEWLGLVPDKGPSTATELATWSQQNRMSQYCDLLDQLAKTNRVYACTCSRTDIDRQSEDGIYPGTCRNKHLPLDTPAASWRLNTQALDPVEWLDAWSGPATITIQESLGDPVIRRKDGIPAYHIASLSDDELWGISFIARGRDLTPSTAIQLALARAASQPHFPRSCFLHHSLITDPKGAKLSKSAGTQMGPSTLASWRAENRNPSALYHQAARWLGIKDHPLIQNLNDLIAAIDLHQLHYPAALVSLL